MMLDWNDYRKQLAVGVKEVGQLNPDTIKGYVELTAAGQKKDLLGAKIRELIALAVAVTARCDGCITVHAEAAIRHGATKEEIAEALGVAVNRLPWLLFALAAMLTAVAVTTAGAIGFVGLIVPHAVRLLLGNDQRLVLPAAVLTGGALLLVADTLARQIVAPAQLPVGVITALIGVPAFLYLLARDRR